MVLPASVVLLVLLLLWVLRRRRGSEFRHGRRQQQKVSQNHVHIMHVLGKGTRCEFGSGVLDLGISSKHLVLCVVPVLFPLREWLCRTVRENG